MLALLVAVALHLLSGPIFALASEQDMTPTPNTQSRKLDCTRLDWMTTGKPVFIEKDSDGVRLGISTEKDSVARGEPVLLGLWIDNQSDKPVFVGRCPPHLHVGDVFDASGHRLIGTQEQATLDAGKNGGTSVYVCASAEMIVEIPAHTCKSPVDAHQDNFRLDYNLAPGDYYVFPGRGTDPTLYKWGLRITVQTVTP